jgi:hypothetical protein
MKLFQIEEPDGSPSDPDAPGAAIGIDVSGILAEVAVAVGGNAAVLGDREGFERELPVPVAARDLGHLLGAWQALFEGAKLRAERSLGRPVTHAVVALPEPPGRDLAGMLFQAGALAGLDLLRLVPANEFAAGKARAEVAAILAEDLAPRSQAP